MQKYLFILFFVSLFFMGCSDDDGVSFKTAKIGEVEYKMPVVTSDVKELTRYLKELTANVTENVEGNVTTITAELSAEESKLFKKFIYTIELNENEELKNLDFSYNFRDLSMLSTTEKKELVEYIANNTTLK